MPTYTYRQQWGRCSLSCAKRGDITYMYAIYIYIGRYRYTHTHTHTHTRTQHICHIIIHTCHIIIQATIGQVLLELREVRRYHKQHVHTPHHSEEDDHTAWAAAGIYFYFFPFFFQLGGITHSTRRIILKRMTIPPGLPQVFIFIFFDFFCSFFI